MTGLLPAGVEPFAGIAWWGIAIVFAARVFRASAPSRFFAALQILLLAGAAALIIKGIGRLA
jgi:hypothetical protein